MNKRKPEKNCSTSSLSSTKPSCTKSSSMIFLDDSLQQQKECKSSIKSKLDPINNSSGSSNRPKRFLLKRSDSGLSSDSSDQGLQQHPSSSSSPSKCIEESSSGYETTVESTTTTTSSSSSSTANFPLKALSKQNNTKLSSKTNSTSNSTKSSHSEVFNMDNECRHHHHHPYHNRKDEDESNECDCLSSSSPESCNGIMNEFCQINYENRSFDELIHHNDCDGGRVDDATTNHYEMTICDLKRQIELISRKVLYMEEHIIDLNTENSTLKKQLDNIEELYKKKIQIREDEIESLKETICELEKINAELRAKEQDLSSQKRMYLEDIKLLKQKVALQETELNMLKDTTEKLSELEILYRNSQEQLEALKISNCKSLKELEENYKIKYMEKNIEIQILKEQIEELSLKIIEIQQQEAEQQQQQQQQLEEDHQNNVNYIDDHYDQQQQQQQQQHDHLNHQSSSMQVVDTFSSKPSLPSSSSIANDIDTNSTIVVDGENENDNNDKNKHANKNANLNENQTTTTTTTSTDSNLVKQVPCPLLSSSLSPPSPSNSCCLSTASLPEISYNKIKEELSVSASSKSECSLNCPQSSSQTSPTTTTKTVANFSTIDEICSNKTSSQSSQPQPSSTTSASVPSSPVCCQPESSESCVENPKSSTSSAPSPSTKMSDRSGAIFANRKRLIKRISSCDIGEDYDFFEKKYSSRYNSPTMATTGTGITSLTPIGQQNVHLANCGDLMATCVDSNNNLLLRSELLSGLQSENKPEVFPSLPDVMLRKLCLLRESTCSIESLSEQEIDAKFHTLALAFKTDKFTLDQRVQLYRHQRDVAENDAKTEINHLSEYVQELYRLLLGCDSKYFLSSNLNQLKELKDMLDKIDKQTQIIKASIMKISSRSELYGSVKQEEKLSTAFDVILLHTENLKRAKERDAKELEDMKRLLANSGLKNENSDFDLGYSHGRRAGRSNSKNKENSRRFSPLLMANQLQNIQLSYHQTSSGPSQNYLRTRRLSVPAAEIRNRPKLLQLLSETSSKRLSEELTECSGLGGGGDDDDDNNDDRTDDDNNDDDDNGNNNSGSDSSDNENGNSSRNLRELRSRKHTITPIIPTEEENNGDGYADDENGSNYDNYGDNLKDNDNDIDPNNNNNNNNDNDYGDNSQQNETFKCLLPRISISDDNPNSNRNKAKKFYKELVARLAPFEDKTLIQKFNEKFRLFFNTILMILITLRNIGQLKLKRLKQANKNLNLNSYETIRYLISGALITISVIILIWSIILPMFK